MDTHPEKYPKPGIVSAREEIIAWLVTGVVSVLFIGLITWVIAKAAGR